jgi:hypothetical protein
MIQRIGLVVASLVVGAAAMLGAFSLGQALAAPVTVPAFVAPGDALQVATPAALETPRAALPDPADAPAEAASLVYQLYKSGHLIPALVVAGFFLLTLLQRWVAWLRTGYRKLAVACALAGLGMLAERARRQAHERPPSLRDPCLASAAEQRGLAKAADAPRDRLQREASHRTRGDEVPGRRHQGRSASRSSRHRGWRVAMGLRLSRNLGSPATLVAGEFCLDAGLIHVACPGCGTLTVLDDAKHIVARDGRVTPAWRCPACPVVEWITLEPLT